MTIYVFEKLRGSLTGKDKLNTAILSRFVPCQQFRLTGPLCPTIEILI